MTLLSESRHKVGDTVTVISAPTVSEWNTPYHANFVGQSGKVVLVGLDIYNQWIYDLEIGGVKHTSFRIVHLRKMMP